MRGESKKILGVFARYLIILLAGLGNLYIFYKILTPLTIGVLSSVLLIFSEPIVIGNFIQLTNMAIEIVPACVAGSAFYLLFILVLSTPKIKIKRRLIILAISFISLFILNILRILFLILISDKTYFTLIHWIFWHLISTIFVVGIWLVMVRIYKIKEVPIYSDFKYVKGLIKPSKKSHRRKKN